MSSRPSGKAFSFRLRDDERAAIEAGVARANKGKSSWERDFQTIGSFVKKAALAAAEASAPRAKAKTPASGPTTRSRGTTAARVHGRTKLQHGPTAHQAPNYLQATKDAIAEHKRRLEKNFPPVVPPPDGGTTAELERDPVRITAADVVEQKQLASLEVP